MDFVKNRIDVTACKSWCVGHAMQFEYGKLFRSGAVIAQYMLDKLEGLQIKCCYVAPQHEKKAALTSEQRSSGYGHIRDHGPKANNMNQFMEWADAEVHDENSPIFGWAEQLLSNAN